MPILIFAARSGDLAHSTMTVVRHTSSILGLVLMMALNLSSAGAFVGGVRGSLASSVRISTSPSATVTRYAIPAPPVERLIPIAKATATTSLVFPRDVRRRQPVAGAGRLVMRSSASGEDGGGDVAADKFREDGEHANAEEEAKREDVGPVGLEGLEDDESLFELVGQDYGMMAMLRSDKFKGLIVFLRNIPQREWVSAAAKEYGNDEEIRNMMGRLGELMRMKQYYHDKQKKSRK